MSRTANTTLRRADALPARLAATSAAMASGASSPVSSSRRRVRSKLWASRRASVTSVPVTTKPSNSMSLTGRTYTSTSRWAPDCGENSISRGPCGTDLRCHPGQDHADLIGLRVHHHVGQPLPGGQHTLRAGRGEDDPALRVEDQHVLGAVAHRVPTQPFAADSESCWVDPWICTSRQSVIDVARAKAMP